MILGLALLLLTPGQVQIVPTPEFPRELQTSAIRATVRVANGAAGLQGTGVVVASKGKFIYVLTAHHVVKGADGLEVATFNLDAYPRPAHVYRSAEVVAASPDTRDLALLRVATNGKVPGTMDLCPHVVLPDRPGFRALAVGCGEAGGPTCLPAKVLGKKRVRRPGGGKGCVFWEVDQPSGKGGSGGPLVDRRGYLLGIQSGTSHGKAYFCHADEVRAFLEAAGIRLGGER
jgi:S1-C subfamily serine protease